MGISSAMGPDALQPGLVLVKSQTVGTAVSSVTVSDAFNATYDNYRIIIQGVDSSATAHSITFQLNNSTGSTYRIGGVYADFGTTTLNGYGPAATTRWNDILPLSDINQGGSIDLYGPFLSQATMFTSQGVRNSSTNNSWYMMNGLDTSTASSTGFVVGSTVGGATLTGGTIRVYGYRN